MLFIVLIFFSCSSGNKQTPVLAKNEQNFQIPKLIQQEIKSSLTKKSTEYSFYNSISESGPLIVSTSHYFKTNNNNTNHAWMAGYLLDSESDLINDDNKIDGIYYPDYILSIPDEVQGAAFISGKIILSRSYGRKNNSRLEIYKDTRDELPDTEYITEDNRSIPVWILENQNPELEITAPPMTEGIADFIGSLAVLFESGSDKYRTTAENPQDRIGILNVNF